MAVPEENTEFGMKARRTRLTPADFKRHGYTPHCDCCKAIREAKDSRNHNELCRRRMEEAIGATDEGRDRMSAGYVRVADAEMRRDALHRETDQAETEAEADAGSGQVAIPSADESGKTNPSAKSDPMAVERPRRVAAPQDHRGAKRRGDGEDSEQQPHIFRTSDWDSPSGDTPLTTVEPQTFDIGTPPPAIADAGVSSTSTWRPDAS